MPLLLSSVHTKIYNVNVHLRTNTCHKAPNRQEKKRVSRKQKPKTGEHNGEDMENEAVAEDGSGLTLSSLSGQEVEIVTEAIVESI